MIFFSKKKQTVYIYNSLKKMNVFGEGEKEGLTNPLTEDY